MDGMKRERAWRVRIVVASVLVGCAGVVSGLRHELGPAGAIGLLAVCVVGMLASLRGVHHRVDQDEARRQVFYAGQGSTVWLLLVMAGVAIVPGLLIPLLPGGVARALGVGLLTAALTAAAHAVLAATTTPDPQPSPVPVPLRHQDR